MSEFRAADHAMGLELQIEELNEQRERASVQHRAAEVERLEAEIGSLQAELGVTAERAVVEGPGPALTPELHDAEQLNIDAEPD